MKKLIPILILLITGAITAQDGYNQSEKYYKEVKERVIKIDRDQIVQLAIDITENMDYQYSYRNRQVSNDQITIVYQADEVTDSKYKGEKDLLIRFTAVPPYSFNGVTKVADLSLIRGEKDAVISIWRNLFLPNATKQEIENNYKYRAFVSEKNEIEFTLTERGRYWMIEKK